MHQKTLFGLREQLDLLSRHGDPLEILDRAVDFEHFRDRLLACLGYDGGSRSGRPAFDPVAMLKVLILQTRHNLSDARMEFMIRDRLSWMRFLSFGLGDFTPDENTLRHFRNRLSETGTLAQRAPMPRSRPFARGSNTYSRIRRTAMGCSSAPSASDGPRRQ